MNGEAGIASGRSASGTERRIVLWWCLALCVAAHIARRPSSLTNPEMWAEDAVVFHLHVEEYGAASLLLPNAGYHLTVPRLIAWVGSWFDPAAQPAIYTFAALACAGIVSALLLFGLRFPGGRTTSLGFALAHAVAPHFSHEVFHNITNVQWVLAPLLLAMLVAEPPRTRRGAAALAGVALLVGTTTPWAAALLPLAIWRVAAARAWLPRVVPGVVALAGVVQLLAILRGAAASPEGWWSVPDYLQMTGIRLGMETFLPPVWWSEAPGARTFVGAAVWLGLAALGLSPGTAWRERATLFAGFALMFAAACVRVFSTPQVIQDPAIGDRYFYVLRAILLWSVVMFSVARLRGRWRVGVTVASVAAAMVAGAASFAAPSLPPSEWAKHAPALRAGQPTEIPIAPPGWIYRYPGRPPE